MRRPLLLTAALAALAGCHAHAEADAPRPAIRVRCAAAESRDWSDLRVLRGTVATPPDRDAVVSAQVAGRLLRVLVREGDRVERDAVIAEVESQPLRNALRQAEAQLANAAAARSLAASVATREEHLVARGISARQALDAARATLAQATAASESARAQVDLARQSVERSRVRAPIAGVVVRLLRRVGEVVDGTPTTPVAEIADPSTLELAASAPARDLVALAVGQPAQVTFDALPGERIAATVRSVSPAVDTATGVGSVRLALQVTRLRPPLGLLGSAEVTTSAPRRVVTVPATAVRNAGGARTEVVVCLGGHAHPRAVEAGLRREGVVEVVRGLDPGAHVATEEIVGLDEGTAIQEAP